MEKKIDAAAKENVSRRGTEKYNPYSYGETDMLIL